MIASARPKPKPAAIPRVVIASSADVDHDGDAAEAEEEEEERSERFCAEAHAERLIHVSTSVAGRTRVGAERHLRLLLPSRGCEEAGDRARTGDIQLGRLTLYQLSYARVRLA